jgi:hypothetical protein
VAGCGFLAGAPECARGPGSPFSVAAVTTAVRRQGIVVFRTPPSAGGCAPGAVAFIGNVQSLGPHENVDSSSQIISKYGDVSCEIDAKPAFPARVTKYTYEGGRRVVLDRRNVECSIHPGGPRARWPNQVRRVARAMQALR